MIMLLLHMFLQSPARRHKIDARADRQTKTKFASNANSAFANSAFDNGNSTFDFEMPSSNSEKGIHVLLPLLMWIM
jgi:hypothetical protein